MRAARESGRVSSYSYSTRSGPLAVTTSATVPVRSAAPAARRRHDGDRAHIALVGRRRLTIERKAADMFRAERRDERARRVERDHSPLVDDGHAIAEALRFVHVIRGQHDRAPFRAKL